MKLLHPGRLRLLIFVAALLTLGLLMTYWAFSPLKPPPDCSLTIKPGSSLSQIANKLVAKGVIRSTMAFRLLALLQGSESAIQAGHYRFKGSASPETILARLVRGEVMQISITIPEGFNLRQIATRLADKDVADRIKLLAAAHNPAFLAELGIKAQTLEGYLFPETYRFVPGISEFQLLRMMVTEFNHQFTRLQQSLPQKSSLTKHQLVTLASIIQKETGRTKEMPLISAVFHNRLRRNIPLQTDPTVIYGIHNFNGNLTRRDLRRPSPYNSYLNRGLPPGPIASPGYNALLAAARPAHTDDLYFVARGNGGHKFSKTLKEHNRAVRKYQLHLRR